MTVESMPVERYARICGPSCTIERYLPVNYRVVDGITVGGRPWTLIAGQDSAGWTLDGYVLPRLASGLYCGEEIRTTDAEIPGQTPADEAWWQR